MAKADRVAVRPFGKNARVGGNVTRSTRRLKSYPPPPPLFFFFFFYCRSVLSSVAHALSKKFLEDENIVTLSRGCGCCDCW